MNLGWNRLIHHPYKAVIRRHCDPGFVALRKVYQNSAQEPEFRRPNWFRTERTLKDIGSCVEDYLPAQVCTRSRIIELGRLSTTICHLGNICCRLGRDVRFDPKPRASTMTRRRTRCSRKSTGRPTRCPRSEGSDHQSPGFAVLAVQVFAGFPLQDGLVTVVPVQP
jgi:hypothetical protein